MSGLKNERYIVNYQVTKIVFQIFPFQACRGAIRLADTHPSPKGLETGINDD